jgi:hypothetical protein
VSSGSATRTSGGGDAGRAALYAAELAAFDGTDLEVPHGQAAATRLASVVTDGDWWPGPEVVVRAARAGAGSSSCRAVGQNRGGSSLEIRLATSQTTAATIAHELAHALAGPHHGHDALFRRAYLDLITVVTNSDPTARRHSLHVRQLADALRLAGLVVADREWPAPPPILDGPIAL